MPSDRGVPPLNVGSAIPGGKPSGDNTLVAGLRVAHLSIEHGNPTVVINLDVSHRALDLRNREGQHAITVERDIGLTDRQEAAHEHSAAAALCRDDPTQRIHRDG